MGAQFLREQALLRSAAPVLGLRDPAVGPLRILGTVEPAGIYRGLARISPGVPQRRKRDAPAFALGSRLGAIDEDAEKSRSSAKTGPRSGQSPAELRPRFPAPHLRQPPCYSQRTEPGAPGSRDSAGQSPERLSRRVSAAALPALRLQSRHANRRGVMCPVLGGRGRQACGWPSSRNLPPLCQPGSSLLPRSTFICVVFER